VYIVHYGAGISVLQRHWVAFRRFISPPEEREKVGLYSYWKICTKELLNTGACFWSTPWWQLEQEDKFDRVHAAVQKARTASCLALYHVSFTFSMRETGH
jgi:hypothetical protein